MKFEAKYYKERLTIINPEGDVGVVTLWSKVESALQVMSRSKIDLSPEKSRVAIVANLYGNGLPQMLRNLLWNPQIKHLLVLGKDLSGSAAWLVNFFRQGLEEVEFLGSKSHRICGTNRVIDGLVTHEQFNSTRIAVLDELTAPGTKSGLVNFFQNLDPFVSENLPRVEPPPIPEPEISRFPSETRSHAIEEKTPLKAWLELVFRLHRFGYLNMIAKKTGSEKRQELLNVRVVVTEPREESAENLAEVGFILKEFKDYQRLILDPAKPPDLDYTYGNRLRGYFHISDGSIVDSLEVVAARLRETPDSRHGYISLWDNSRDLPEGKGCPCFVSAFFRKFEGKLNLTATFRTHNAMDAWLENFYGLMAIQKFVAEKCQMETGPITVFSHSVSISPDSFERAEKVVEHRNRKSGKKLALDPNGEFAVTIDYSTWEIVVEHSFEGVKVGQYRGRTVEEIETQLNRDHAISLISHALYLGRELARKEFEIKSHRAKLGRPAGS